MKIKNKILTAILGLTTLASAETINVTPQDDWKQIVQTSINGTTISMSEGLYEMNPFQRVQIPEGVDLEGVIGINDMYINERDWIPTTFSSTVIQGRGSIDVKGNNSIKNIIFEEHSLYCEGEFFRIDGNYFINNTGNSLVLYPIDGNKTFIDKNVFFNCNVGISNSLATAGQYSPLSKVRENNFHHCDIGIYTAFGLDIGTATDEGNNVFMSETNIRNDGLIQVPAEYNTWYGKRSLIEGKGNPDEYIFLDNETDIRKTIDDVLLKNNKDSYRVEVVPFNTQDYFEKPEPTPTNTPYPINTPTPTYSRTPTPQPTPTLRKGYELFDFSNNWQTPHYESSDLLKYLESQNE